MPEIVLPSLAMTMVGAIMLGWVFDGYARTLAIWSWMRRSNPPVAPSGSRPTVAIMLTVHDEEATIEARLRNLSETRYPRELLEIVVVSDRSTDATDAIVHALAGEHPEIRLESFDDSSGKSDAQNRALEAIEAEVVVFTDADTTFDPECIERLMSRFDDEQVGMVDAELRFDADHSAVGRSQGWYWRYERRVRRLESELGLLAVGSGACLAVRRSLLRTLPANVGEDCVVPLMVVASGRRVVQESTALAWDSMPSDPKRELQTRARMTARNIIGTLSYPRLLNPMSNPGLAFGLWSHKLLRWLSPLWLFLLLVGAIALGFAGGAWRFVWMIPASLAILAVLGANAHHLRVRVPLAGAIWSFLLANLGFAWGICRVLRGTTAARYRSG